MVCPFCKTEAAIMECGYEVEGDQSPDTETKIYSVMRWHCRNRDCDHFEKEIGKTRAEIYRK